MTSLPCVPEPLDITFNEDALPKLVGAFARFGDAYSIFSPETDSKICVFSHPDHVRHVFVDKNANYTKGIGIDRVRILLGGGIMTSEGETWRRQRKMIQPAFHRDVIGKMFADIRNANLQLRTDWHRLALTGKEFDLTQYLSEVTLKIVLHAIFGADMAFMAAASGENPFMLLMQEPGRNLQFA
jgi:cytochrome P450